jgi:hypothetical protein
LELRVLPLGIVKKVFKIKINAGECSGRYVGPLHIAGCRTDQGLTENPEVPVPGAGVSLYVQDDFAILFFEPLDLQAELKCLGFDTELVEVACPEQEVPDTKRSSWASERRKPAGNL